MAWLSGWSYRKEITITGQSGAGTNYQVDFSIGDSAGGDFHLEGHCTNFPQDIEVTDNDETTLLDFWIEDITVDPLKMWVEVADDLGSNQTIYIYYGKSGATTDSDGVATFPDFFDDFSSGTGKWSEQSGSISITSEIASTNPTANHGGVRSVSTFSLSGGKILEAYQQYEDITDTQNAIGFSEVSGATTWYNFNTIIMRATGTEDRWETWGKTAADVWGAGTIDADWHTIKIIAVVGNNGIIEVSNETGTKSPAWSIADDTYYLWLTKTYDAYQTTHITKTKWVFIRKYNTTEPAFSSAGSEETPPTGVTMPLFIHHHNQMRA